MKRQGGQILLLLLLFFFGCCYYVPLKSGQSIFVFLGSPIVCLLNVFDIVGEQRACNFSASTASGRRSRTWSSNKVISTFLYLYTKLALKSQLIKH